MIGTYFSTMTGEPLIPAELWDKIPADAQAAVLAAFAQLRGSIEALGRRIVELERRVGQNASNSSIPPSANPPAAPPPVQKKPTGRRRGGQPGHPGHSRARPPAGRVSHTIKLIPDRCGKCSAPLSAEPSAADPQPSWHQVIEIPASAAVVTEFQGHARACACCGFVTRESVPAEVRRVTFGPRLAAALSYLAGCQHVSARGLEELAGVLFGVPLSLGAVAALQRQMSQALAEAHERLGQEVGAAAAKNVDETSWKLKGVKHWLWVAVAGCAVYLLVQRRRSAAALKALLGEKLPGIITSDRWSAYHAVPIERRQVCRAHRKRDFQATVDAGGQAAKAGEGLLVQTAALFEAWYRVRDGTRTRRWLRKLIEGQIRPKVKALLRQGSVCPHAPSAGTCTAILDVEEGRGPVRRSWMWRRGCGRSPATRG